jgi:hypothetical protein
MADDREERTADPIAILARDYAADLRTIRMLSPTSVTRLEIGVMQKMVLKYGMADRVTADNFFEVQGRLSYEVSRKLQELSIKHVLQHEMDRNPAKRPAKSRTSAEDVKEAI